MYNKLVEQRLVSFSNLCIPVNFYIKSALSSESGAQARGFLQSLDIRFAVRFSLNKGCLLHNDLQISVPL